MDKPFGLYEMIPGVAANIIAMVIVTYATKEPSEAVTSTFDKAVALSHAAKKDPETDFEEAAKSDEVRQAGTV